MVEVDDMCYARVTDVRGARRSLVQFRAIAQSVAAALVASLRVGAGSAQQSDHGCWSCMEQQYGQHSQRLTFA